MKKTVFLYSGEGTNSAETGFRLLKQSPLWARIEEILSARLQLGLEQVWEKTIATHRCPHSPLLTVVAQICLADLWRRWGYPPDVVVGHSTGELAAAYQAGLYSLEDTLELAYRIGEIASRLEGVMLHGRLSDAEIDGLNVNLSSYNFEDNARKHVTLSGYPDEMEAFHDKFPDFVKMKLPHPWHHPDYGPYSDRLPVFESARIDEGNFVSGVTTQFESHLEDDHWRRWLVQAVDFIQTMRTLNERYGDHHLEIIEIGFHPVLEKCCDIFPERTYVSSMFRAEDDFKWILNQRKKLDQTAFTARLQNVLDDFSPGLDYDEPLAYQGFSSLKFTELSVVLQPLFPSLAPQDFYRYKTINQLIDRFGIAATYVPHTELNYEKNGVVITGMSCRFPSSVETLPQFWEMLLSKTDQVRSEPSRGRSEGGYLDSQVAKFDHQYFNISKAEAKTMDPQQVLALELTEMLWKDADIDPQTLDPNRIGVYIGVWSQEYHGDRSSVYYPGGTNPSIIASRISYRYDLRGPSWVSNTACSSSLVAVHYAAKDIEAGRVDYAIAGGVNMLLDEEFSASMRNAGFLSSDDRCKAFDNSANGYVRAEGGGLVLLANKSLADRFYAELIGSSINQNGGRSQLITAPHPEAQEELILAACQDARVKPQQIAYIESHGTGTKIGDPIEMSAIQNTIARDRSDTCYVGSIKSNIGHLESAAGIAGLIKSVAALNRGIIPPNLHFDQPNSHIDFESYPVKVVHEETPIDRQALIGISSFGFGGSNAHVIVRGAAEQVRKEIRPIEVPFNRERAAALGPYLRVMEPEQAESPEGTDTDRIGKDIRSIVQDLMFTVTGIESFDPNLELLEQGLDSLSATELFHHLQEKFNIEIEPETLFDFPLPDQFVQEIERKVMERNNGESTPAQPAGEVYAPADKN